MNELVKYAKSLGYSSQDIYANIASSFSYEGRESGKLFDLRIVDKRNYRVGRFVKDTARAQVTFASLPDNSEMSILRRYKKGSEEYLISLRPLYTLSTWAYFQYMELIELEESRATAKAAFKSSKQSLVVAISAIIISTSVSVINSCSTQEVLITNSSVPTCTHEHDTILFPDIAHPKE